MRSAETIETALARRRGRPVELFFLLVLQPPLFGTTDPMAKAGAGAIGTWGAPWTRVFEPRRREPDWAAWREGGGFGG